MSLVPLIPSTIVIHPNISTFLFCLCTILCLVSQQRYGIDILRESVILGNDAIFKCSIPSFVAEFVSVTAWIDSEKNEFAASIMRNSLGNNAAEYDNAKLSCAILVIFSIFSNNGKGCNN